LSPKLKLEDLISSYSGRGHTVVFKYTTFF
jgi:hypothetical protein